MNINKPSVFFCCLGGPFSHVFGAGPHLLDDLAQLADLLGVRALGRELGLPEAFVGRHPFPGPGLAIRILGAVTPEKVALLQEVDHIFIQGLRDEGLYDQVWQAGAILLPVHSVGVMGDERTYEWVIAIRAVESQDAMTADWARLPYDVLQRASTRIINEVKGINRVVYD